MSLLSLRRPTPTSVAGAITGFLLLAVAGVLFFGWVFMLTVGVVHADWISAVPTLDYAHAVWLSVVLRLGFFALSLTNSE